MRYDSAILDRKPQLAHRLTSFMFQELVTTSLEGKSSAGVAGEVYQILMRSPGVFPSMEDVARAMHMTSRTLRRRLNDRAVSFTAIVDDFHRAVAIEYVAKTKLSYDDIAVLAAFQMSRISGEPSNDGLGKVG